MLAVVLTCFYVLTCNHLCFAYFASFTWYLFFSCSFYMPTHSFCLPIIYFWYWKFVFSDVTVGSYSSFKKVPESSGSSLWNVPVRHFGTFQYANVMTNLEPTGTSQWNEMELIGTFRNVTLLLGTYTGHTYMYQGQLKCGDGVVFSSLWDQPLTSKSISMGSAYITYGISEYHFYWSKRLIP